MDPVTVFLGLSALSSALGIFGDISAAYAQEEAAQRNRELKEQEANELLSRQAINENIMRERAVEAASEYSASFASTGRAGAGIGGMLKIQRDTEEAVMLSRRDAEFRAKMLKLGADIELELASDRVTASYITGAGTLIGAGAKVYNTLRPAGTPNSLPDPKFYRTGLSPNFESLGSYDSRGWSRA